MGSNKVSKASNCMVFLNNTVKIHNVFRSLDSWDIRIPGIQRFSLLDFKWIHRIDKQKVAWLKVILCSYNIRPWTFLSEIAP